MRRAKIPTHTSISAGAGSALTFPACHRQECLSDKPPERTSRAVLLMKGVPRPSPRVEMDEAVQPNAIRSSNNSSTSPQEWMNTYLLPHVPAPYMRLKTGKIKLPPQFRPICSMLLFPSHPQNTPRQYLLQSFILIGRYCNLRWPSKAREKLG